MSLRTLVISIALLVAIHSHPSFGQESTASTAKSALGTLPQDTTLLVRVRNCADFAKKWKASPFYSLKDHPSFKEFLDYIEKEFDEGISEAREKLGFDPLDLIGKIEGEVVLAVGGIEKLVKAIAAQMNSGAGVGAGDVNPGDVPILLQFDAGSSKQAVKEYLEKVIQFAQGVGASKKDEPFQEGTITTLTNTKKDSAGDIENLYLGEHGTSFLISLNRPFLEKNMAAIAGSSGSALSSDADFTATNRTVDEGADFLVYVNISSIVNAVRTEIQSNPMIAMFWGVFEGQILGRQLKNLGLTMSLKDDGVHQKVFINDGGAKDGLLGVFDGPGFSSRNPGSIVPQDADQFSKTVVNIQHLYSIVKQLANMVLSASGNAGMDIEQFFELQFQIKLKDVIESLGNEVVGLKRPGDGKEKSGLAELFGGEGFTLALKLRDEAPIRNLMAELASEGSFQAEKYLERDLYRLDPGSGDSGPAVGFLNKMVVFGLTEGRVKDLMRRDGKDVVSIKDNPEFQALLGTTPEKVIHLEYYGKNALKQSLSVLDLLKGELLIPDLEPALALVSGSISYAEWRDKGLYGGGVLSYVKKK